MSDCIFCKIGAHEATANVEIETDNVIAFASIAPVAKIHILIIPKEHIATFTDLEQEHASVLMEMAKVAQALIEKKNISNKYKLIFNGGKYQSVKHIHWHLVGGDWNENEEKQVVNET